MQGRPEKDPVTSTQNSIKVDKSYLTINASYKVSCEVMTGDRVKYGYVEKMFNTKEFEQDFNFTVRPKEGKAYDTLFELKAIKPNDEALKCEFGYYNQYGEVLIDDQSKIATRHSSSN